MSKIPKKEDTAHEDILQEAAAELIEEAPAGMAASMIEGLC